MSDNKKPVGPMTYSVSKGSNVFWPSKAGPIGADWQLCQQQVCQRNQQCMALPPCSADIAAALTIVPIEPTAAMLEAARDWSYREFGKPIGNDAATGCWQAMVEAARLRV